MAKAIFKVFFKVIKAVVGVVLAPVNALVSGIFPDFSNMLANFNTAVDTFLGNGLTYFFHIFPPQCRGIVVLYLGLLISYYTVSITLHGILKVYTIIKNIKFW